MKRFGWLFVFLLFAIPVRSQVPDCDQLVADYASVLAVGQSQKIAGAAQPLIDAGADLRVRIVGATTNLDMDEKSFERSCPSWRSPSGRGPKSTLIVLMVSPVSHKMGIYYGAAFRSALDAHFNRIKQTYMAPYFKDGDWVGGFVATEQQLTARLQAAKDEAVHPAVSTTVNQAADLSGLWAVFGWIVALGAIVMAIGLFMSWWRRRKQEGQAIREAQQNAIAAKAQAADLLRSPPANANIDAASQEFTRLDSSLRSDPYATDLSIEEYKVIESQFRKVVSLITGMSYKSPAQSQEQHKEKTKNKHTPSHGAVAAASTANASVVSGVPMPVFVPEPVIIEEPVIEREPARTSWQPDPEPSRSSRSSRSSDDDAGGGSSSWGGSSDDSGGGSSDFGGGDSSGGGGSSDF